MKCLCYSRCLLGPKYTLVFVSLLNALGYLSIVPLYFFLLLSCNHHRGTSVALLRQHWKAFFGRGSRMYGDLHDDFELAV